MLKRITIQFLLSTSAILFCSLPLGAQERDSLGTRAEKMKTVKYLESIYRVDDAIEILSEMAKTDSLDQEVLGELADCHTMNGDYENAEALCKTLSELSPESIPVKVRLLQVQKLQNKFSLAAQSGKEVLQLDSIPAIISTVGDCLAKAEQPDSALVYYQKALRLNPMNGKVVSKAAKILLGKKDYDGVVKLAGKYLENDPDNFEIAPVMGLAYYLSGDFKNCIRVMARQDSLGNDSYGVHFYYGQSLWQINENLEAREELGKAWQIDSTDANLAYSIGAVETPLSVKDDYGIAWNAADPEKWLGKAIDMVSPNPLFLSRVYQQYGAYYFHHKEYGPAIENYKKAYELNSETISALSTIAYCYEQKKDYKAAQLWYQKYLDVGTPGTKGYDYVLESMGYIKEKLFMENQDI